MSTEDEDLSEEALEKALVGKSPLDQAKIRQSFNMMRALADMATDAASLSEASDGDKSGGGCGDPDCEMCGGGGSGKVSDPAKLLAKALRDAARSRARAAVAAEEDHGLSEAAKKALAATQLRSPITFGSGGGSLWDDD